MKRKIITDSNAPLAKENPKDFSKLLEDFNSAGAGGSASGMNWLGIAAVVGAITVGLVFYFNAGLEEQAETLPSNPKENTLTAKAADSDFKLPVWEQIISVKEALTVVSPEGVILEIPAMAFTDGNGIKPE